MLSMPTQSSSQQLRSAPESSAHRYNRRKTDKPMCGTHNALGSPGDGDLFSWREFYSWFARLFPELMPPS